ncbi:glutamine amidotransferase [Pseudoclavibacter chungangensis]|uniref:Glutamine amidotransferase n=1 Tax=Pseudoclavibacter chungangensis TaxID=587635 RepID=A0A7J5BPX9_9MICO|nr:glutamine amidotransferase [Pseudoclavibacter chungangensis]KAB1655369.1 glutamine amidotransferase [Pseudoclavibacter chungangensis]NYJ68319.1 GMP synthase (glutamine-hydrolyzing) [Pseudoclavibacter chungangensis]
MTRHALAVRHVAFEDLGILGPVLAEHGFEVELLDAGIDRITAERLREPELVVVLGGPIGVSDTAAYPFLAAERSGLATRMQAGHPTLGVCLGAQLMASALGATVESTGRTEIGYAPLTLTAEGRHSVLAPLDGVPVLHWHGDQFAIPAGARRLAETPGFPNQAFALGDALLGLQFHLEGDHTQIERWLIGHAHELASAGIDPVAVREDAARHGPRLADAARLVFDAWIDTALPAD